MHRAIRLGCHCTPDLAHGWYARCNECGWRFKIVHLVPSLDGKLVSLTCPKRAGTVTRVPEEQPAV
jgi:hypothetical protein